MKPFLVTALQAAKMPRWLLLLLCVLYAVPGLVGRDPWRMEDAAGFGIAWTMARGEQGLLDWLLPNVVGQPVYSEGPLPFWLGALTARLLPGLPADALIRSAAIVWLGGLFVALWYAVWRLARRPGVQPADPFGASASHVDYGRAIADCALLLLLATLGLLARSHETTAEAAQVAWIGVFLFGLALTPERPWAGGLVVGLAIGATTLTRGLPLAMALGAVTLALPVWVGAFRWVARPFLGAAWPLALLLSAAWPVALTLAGPPGTAHLSAWLAWNLDSVSGPSLEALTYALRTLPWYLWPAWPLGLWTLWRWRDRLNEPALAVPLLTAIGIGAVALLAPEPSESIWVPLAPATAMIGALGIPTIRRGITSLIDWFAVMSFTLIGLVLWSYWIAFQTGWPPKMAFRAQQSVLGWTPSIQVLELALGLAVTLAWVGLIVWRISRQRSGMWRTVMLPAGGLVLTWCLLMTLWLPAGNHRKTYRDVAQSAGAQVVDRSACVQAVGLDLAQRATFAYFGGLRIDDRRTDCEWLLIADRVAFPRLVSETPGNWTQVWRGQRPTDRRERFRLFRREPG